MKILLMFLMLLVSSQAHAQTARNNDPTIPNDLLGTWDFERISQEARPCSEASISYYENGTFITHSGEQTLRGRYMAEPYQSGYLITQKITSHNSKPNCQGYSGNYVVKNLVPKIYMEVEEDTARQYLGTTTSEYYMELTRKEGSVRDSIDNQ